MYETVNGYPIEEFIKWYEEEFGHSISNDLEAEFSWEELDYLADKFSEHMEMSELEIY